MSRSIELASSNLTYLSVFGHPRAHGNTMLTTESNGFLKGFGICQPKISVWGFRLASPLTNIPGSRVCHPTCTTVQGFSSQCLLVVSFADPHISLPGLALAKKHLLLGFLDWQPTPSFGFWIWPASRSCRVAGLPPNTTRILYCSRGAACSFGWGVQDTEGQERGILRYRLYSGRLLLSSVEVVCRWG